MTKMNEFVAFVLLCCIVVCDSNYHRHHIDKGLQTHPKLEETNVRQKRASNQYGGTPYAPHYPNLQMATTYYFGPQPPVPQAYNQFAAVGNTINNPGNVLDHASRVLNMAQEQYKMANPNMLPNQNLQMAIMLFYGPGSPAPSATLEHNENNRQMNKQNAFDPNLEQQKNINDLFGLATNTIGNATPNHKPTETIHNLYNPQFTGYSKPQSPTMDTFGSKTTPTLGDNVNKSEIQPLLTDADVAENPYLSNYDNAQAVLDDFFGTEKPIQRKSKESTFNDEPTDLKTGIVNYFGPEMHLPPSTFNHTNETYTQTDNQHILVDLNSLQDTKQSNNNEGLEFTALENTKLFPLSKDQITANGNPYLIKYLNSINNKVYKNTFDLGLSYSNLKEQKMNEATPEFYSHIQIRQTNDQYVADPIIQQQKNIEAMFGTSSTKDAKEPRRDQNTRKPVHANIPYEGALSLVSHSADVETTTLSEQDKAILDIFGKPPQNPRELSSQAPSPLIALSASHPSSKNGEANNTEGDDYRFAAPHVLIEKYRSSISSKSIILQTYSLYPLYTIIFSLLFV